MAREAVLGMWVLQWTDVFIKGNAAGHGCRPGHLLTSGVDDDLIDPNDGNLLGVGGISFQVTDNMQRDTCDPST